MGVLAPRLLRAEPGIANSGSIKGTVKFAEGKAASGTFSVTRDAPVCGKMRPLDRLVVGADGGVEYTLIYLKNPPPGRTASPQQAAAVLTQDHCRYVPHMLVAPKGSQLALINDDAVLHNCHGYTFADHATACNIAQPIKGQRTLQALRKAGMLEMECDAGHVWMSAWIWVTDNSYAAVTDAHGDFTLNDVPPGTYTVVMWHEGWNVTRTGQGNRPIFSDPIVQERQVVVSGGGPTTVDFQLQ